MLRGIIQYIKQKQNRIYLNRIYSLFKFLYNTNDKYKI